MLTESISDALAEFCTSHTQEHYLYLRQQMIDSPEYDPYSADMERADQLLSEGKWQDAHRYILSLLPNWLTSPGVHFRIAFVHRKLCKADQEQFEGSLAIWLMEAILATGDGTREKPYLVSRVEDEYDVLEHFGLKRTRQLCVEEETRVLDVLECDNGRSLWFDASVQFEFLSRKFHADG